MAFIPYNPSLPTTNSAPPQVPSGFTPYSQSMPTANGLDQSQSTPPQDPSMPLLTNQQGGFGTALKDVAVGAGKSFIRGTRDVASGLQGLGKGVLGAFGADTSNMGIQSLDNSSPTGSQINNQLQSKSRGEQVGGALETAGEFGAGLSGGNAEALFQKGKGLLNTYRGASAVGDTLADTARLDQTLAPKVTPTETKLAQSQGRLVKGNASTLFKSGTADSILPSQSTKAASQTIIDNIPGAAKMDPTDLYGAVDKHITTTAQGLRPVMEATPIKPETIQTLNEDWSALKKSQMEAAPATEEPNVAKRQAKFESLLQKSGNEHMGHLWDTRITYDNSIPANVKKANFMSPESLQLQKQEWLQNRAILNNAINDTTNGMGKASQDAFGKMSKMYDAKSNLLGKAKVDTSIQPSKLNQAYNSPVGKTVRTVAKLGFGGELIKHELGL